MSKEEKLSKIEKMYKNIKVKPYYLKRALNPNTKTLNNQTVRLADMDNKVYPFIRLKTSGKGGTGNRTTLTKAKTHAEAQADARKNKDFITFKTSTDAQYFARNFSKLIDKKRR